MIVAVKQITMLIRIVTCHAVQIAIADTIRRLILIVIQTVAAICLLVDVTQTVAVIRLLVAAIQTVTQTLAHIMTH